MVVESLNTELKIDHVENGADIVGDAAHGVEAGDACVVVKVVFAAEVRFLSFTREDVLAKLYKNMALAASIVGPNSDAVEQFEADISDVKAGGELAPYAWMFELE